MDTCHWRLIRMMFSFGITKTLHEIRAQNRYLKPKNRSRQPPFFSKRCCVMDRFVPTCFLLLHFSLCQLIVPVVDRYRGSEWGGLSARHDKIGYQKLCFSNSQRDRLSVFLLHLDGRAFYLVKWNCNYSGKTYHPCPESACEEMLDRWQTMLNFLIKIESSSVYL